MPVNRTNSWKLRLGVALSIALGAPDCVLAQATGTSGPTSDVASQTHQEQALNQQHREVNLDLSSTEAVFQSRNANAVNIHVGGSIENGVVTGAVMQTINPGQLLTPAQFMAVKEVLRGGQTLLLNDLGQAVGGYATITSNRVHNLSSIVVPQNVSLNAIGFNASTPLNVSGNLNVFGSMFALQNAANVVSVLQAGNLNIGVGGLLSGNLPATMNPGSSIFSSAGLTVNVANNVTNMGTIATLGSLNITAGGSIVNQSLANTTALMSAQNINLTTGVGQIVNSGLIQALNNINLNTLSSLTNLSIDSSKGVLNALGSINVRDALASVVGNTTLQGGSWISQELNLQSGEGALEVSVETVAGTMNLGAGSAHVLANTPMLTLGNAIITGDPTYVNAGGDIQIVGTISENEDLAIIASGNITAGGAARIINHGHDVWLIAGANVDTSSGSCVGCGNSGLLTTPGSATTITGGFVKVSATGAKGGSIDLSTGNTLSAGSTVIDTTASTTNGAGGNVNLVALANGSTGGRVLFPGSTITSINTSGDGSGANGNVSLVAGATSGQGISIGSITANGGSGAAANILLTASQASFSGGSGGCSACISFNSTGTATGNIASTTPVNGGITIGGPILSANGRLGSISALTPTGNLQVTGSLTAYEVTLASASGNVGSAGSPIEINNGGGGSRLFISSDVVNITNSATENITLVNTATSSLKANTSFTIITNQNIVAATNDSIAISSPNIALWGSGSSNFGSGANESQYLVTAATKTLFASAGNVYLRNTSDLQGFSANAATKLYFINTGDVTLNGNVSLSGPVSGLGSVSLILTSGKTLTNNGFQITSNNLVNLVIDTYTLTGTNPVNAGTGTVSIIPSTSTRPISLGGGAGLVVSGTNMSGITAGTLILGSTDITGGIALGGSIDFSTKYNLQLRNSGDGGFEANGGTLTVGSKSLVIDVGGKVNLASIITNGANLNIKGQSVNLNSAIGSANDTTSISTTFGDIISNAVITAKNLTLDASGYIGKAHAYVIFEHKFTPLETAVTGTLNLRSDDHHMFGDIAVNNTGNLTSFTATSSGGAGVSSKIRFYNVGDVTLGGHITAPRNTTDIYLTLSPGSTLKLNGYHIDSAHTYISTDHLIVGAVVPGDYSIRGGNVQIWPTSPQGVINLGGGTGGLCLSSADLNTFVGQSEPVIGSYNNYGGIHVWGPINAPNVAFQQADGRTPEFNHMNGGDFISHGNAVTALWIDCSGGAVSVAAGSKLQGIVGGSVTIDGPITAQGIVAYQGGITALGTISGVGELTALKGGISAETASTSLTLTALGGDINIVNTGSLSKFSAAAPSGSVSLTNTGNITLERAWYSLPPDQRFNGLDSSTDGIGRYGVYGAKGVSIFQDAASTFTHSSQRIVTKNSPINLVVNSYQGTSVESESGLLHAGTGTVSITPSSNTATVSLFSNAGTIAINSMVFSEIIAGKLILGAPAASGNISLTQPLDLSSKFSLQLVLGSGTSSFNTNGNSITMGSKSLDLTIHGPVNLGSVSTSSTVKVIGESVNIGSVSTASGMTLVATAGSIIGSGKLSTSNLAYSVTGGVIDVNVNGTPLFVDSGGGTTGGFVVLGYLGYLPPGFYSDTSNTTGTVLSSFNASNSGPARVVATTGDSLLPVGVDSGVDSAVDLAVLQSGTAQRTALNTVNVADANVSMVSALESAGLVNQLPVSLGINTSGNKHSPQSSVPVHFMVTRGSTGNLALVPHSGEHSGRRVASIIAHANTQLESSTAKSAGEPEANVLKLMSGNVFVDTSTSMSITTNTVTVLLQKGALVSVVAEDGCTFVRVCSSTGTVSVVIAGKVVALNSGEELLVTDKQVNLHEFKTVDHLGRRNIKTNKIGAHFVTVSEFSILNMIANHHTLRSLHKSDSGADRQLLGRLLKTAASVDVALKHRGAYLD